MPKCSKCGAEISVDSKFCPECGEKVEITEQIQTDIPPLPEIKPITDIAKDTEKEDKKDFGADENLEIKEDTAEKPESAAEAVTVNVEETRQELEKALEDIPEIKKIDGVTEEEKPSDIPPMPPKPVLDAKARRVQIEETARNVQKATDLRNKALSMDLDEPAKPQKPKRKAPVWLIVGLCLIAAAIAVTVLLPVLTPRQQTDTAAVTTVSETAATTSAAETTVTTTVTTTETTVTTTETTVTTTSAASSSETSAATSASGDVSDVSDGSETSADESSGASSETIDMNAGPLYNRTSIEPAIHKEVMGGEVSCTIKLSEMLISADLFTDQSAIAAEYTSTAGSAPIAPVGLVINIGEDKIDVPADAFDETTVLFMYPTILAYVEDAGHTANEINELSFKSVGVPVDVYKVTVE